MNARKNKKEIESVKASDWCQESYPCQHEVTIKYKDGSEKKKHSSGDTIAEKYFSYLDNDDKGHFSGYLSKSGMFGNQSSSKSDSESEQELTSNPSCTMF